MIRTLIIIFVVVGIAAYVSYIHSRPQAGLIKPSTSLDSWGWQQDENAKGKLDLDDGALRCTISQTGPVPRDLQVYQVGPVIENGRTYQIKFSARANADRVIALSNSINHMMFTNQGLEIAVPVSAQWQHFQYLFVGANADGKPDRLPTFVVGQSVGSVWIKDITVDIVK